MNWREFSFVCLPIGVAAFLISTLIFFHLLATTPNASLGAMIPIHIKVTMRISASIGMLAAIGFLIAAFKQQENCR